MTNATSTISLASPTVSKLFPFYAPVHVSRVRRGCWACCLQPHFSAKAWERFLSWKEQPSQHPDVTQFMAGELVRLIRECFPVLPQDWLVTTPPQGKSAVTGSEYPAGFLTKAVAERLDLDYVTCFAPAPRRSRGRFESIRRDEPFELIYVPDTPVVVIDDLCTSGLTLRTALDTLTAANVVAFGFVYSTSG